MEPPLLDKFIKHMKDGAAGKAMESLYEIYHRGNDVCNELKQRQILLETNGALLKHGVSKAHKEIEKLREEQGKTHRALNGVQLVKSLSKDLQEVGETQCKLAKEEMTKAEEKKKRAEDKLRANRFLLLVPIVSIFVFISREKSRSVISRSMKAHHDGLLQYKEGEGLVRQGRQLQSGCDKHAEELCKRREKCEEKLNDIHRQLAENKRELRFILLGVSACQEVMIHAKHATQKTAVLWEDCSVQSLDSSNMSDGLRCSFDQFKKAWGKVYEKSDVYREITCISQSGLQMTGFEKMAMVANVVCTILFMYLFWSPLLFVVRWVLANIFFVLLGMLLHAPNTYMMSCLEVVASFASGVLVKVCDSKLAKFLQSMVSAVYTIFYPVFWILSTCYSIFGMYYTIQFVWIVSAACYLFCKGHLRMNG